jgi:hypothetical protein
MNDDHSDKEPRKPSGLSMLTDYITELGPLPVLTNISVVAQAFAVDIFDQFPLKDRVLFARIDMELRTLIDQMKEFRSSLNSMSEAQIERVIESMREVEIDQLLARAARDPDPKERTDGEIDHDPADDWKRDV